VIFILKRQWQHIGWMIFYLIGTPLFSFLIPVYSFWHFDDFSWGNTRVVVGEGGKKKVLVSEEGVFDPSCIPLRTWAEYEEELMTAQQEIAWETGSAAESVDSHHSHHTHRTHKSRVVGSVMGDDYRARPVSMAMTVTAPPHGEYMGNGLAMTQVPSAPPLDPRMSYNGRPSSRYLTMGSGATTSRQSTGYMTMSAGYGMQNSFDNSPMTPTGMMEAVAPPPSVVSHDYFVPPGAPEYAGSVGGFDPVGQRMSGHSSQRTSRGSANLYPNAPSDYELDDAIAGILSSADLNTVTKKQVREQLSSYFGCDLGARRDYINRAIELFLQSGNGQ